MAYFRVFDGLFLAVIGVVCLFVTSNLTAIKKDGIKYAIKKAGLSECKSWVYNRTDPPKATKGEKK